MQLICVTLTCDEKRSGAVGFASVILSKARVLPFVRLGNVADLQTPVLPKEHPVSIAVVFSFLSFLSFK